MTTSRARRMRRGGLMQGSTGRFVKGLLLSIGVTAALVVVFALIVGLTNASDGVIRTGNQLIKVISVLLGVWAAVDRGDAQGALRGALLGLVYMALGVLVSALGTGMHLTLSAWAMDVLIGVSIGGLMGLLRRQMG